MMERKKLPANAGGFLFMMGKPKSIVERFLKKFSIALLVILAAVLGGFFWWKANISAVSSQPSAISKIFVVKKGESLSLVANRLEKEGLIRSALAFKILVSTQGLANKIQAGDFRLRSSLTAKEIAQILTHGTLDVWLTFPEGWRREEYGQRLAANLEDFDYQEFLDLTENLEGKLFPDTYLIPKDASPSAVIKILTQNFEKKTKDLKISRQELILASIVEREARVEEDRSIVAGILLKRWQKNWALQADATIQYAIATAHCPLSTVYCQEWWPKKLTKEDLNIDSPYNTYKYKGLPPKPICNPGLAAIKAVLNPVETDYWFYLSDSQGKIHYAKTLEEHEENISKYLLK
jgi:UPF0755 protein